ncbi:hypothetical protein ACIBKY_51980 [Nonomuraea sp. NPDC050394]|uniref:hypothetical protein n=1 Tax=Nonomuraea sp. NPDC050394 TaxID=3364363 RepID=UPI0037959BD3
MGLVMARRAPSTSDVPEAHDTSWDRLWAREASRVIVYLPPWMGLGLVYGIGSFFWAVLSLDDDPPDTIAWTMFLLSVCTVVLAGVTWWQSHARSIGGRIHSVLTTALAGLWVCAATISSPIAVGTGRLMLICGTTVALTWNIRSMLRRKGVDTAAVVADPLKALFGQGAEKAGITAEATTTKTGEHKVEGSVQLEEGEAVAEDLQKRAPYIESGMGLPPGSITVAVDPDDASKAKVTISDPRVLRTRIPWPGASRPGGSIADPIRIGLWQDLDMVELVLCGYHLQIMGMSGSGKSIGAAWNILSELMTRHDVAIFAADVTKADQTLGPLENGLHRVEYDLAGARAMLRQLYQQVAERTAWLAAQGLQKWKQGCGLAYWVIWLEEAPDILSKLPDKEMEDFLSLVKALRSAGGTVVMSLQRSDWTQMPTLARGQLAKMCLGVESAGDAKFGLSAEQRERGAKPEQWAQKQPGMAYLDAPSIPDERIAMALRTWDWGEDDQEANQRMREHAADWPASPKDADEFTRIVAANFGAAASGLDGDPPEETEPPVGDKVKTENPSPDLTAGMDDPIEAGDDRKFPAGPRPKLPPEEARGVLLDQLAVWVREERLEFATKDLRPVKELTGYTSRGWLNDQLNLLADDGVIERDDERRCYRIIRPDVLLGEPAGV